MGAKEQLATLNHRFDFLQQALGSPIRLVQRVWVTDDLRIEISRENVQQEHRNLLKRVFRLRISKHYGGDRSDLLLRVIDTSYLGIVFRMEETINEDHVTLRESCSVSSQVKLRKRLCEEPLSRYHISFDALHSNIALFIFFEVQGHET